MTVTFDTETIRLITLFENLTGTGVKDCIIDNGVNTVYFIIEEGEIGKAIGKNGSSVKNVENLIRKDVKIFEFSDDLNSFVKNLIPQANDIKIKNEDNRTVIEIRVDKKNKALVMGRDCRNFKLCREMLQRNHRVDDLIVK
jgi:N utilization substance protein A